MKLPQTRMAVALLTIVIGLVRGDESPSPPSSSLPPTPRSRRRRPPQGPTNLGTCTACQTRDEQLRSGAPFIPLFVKFHKVGSGTIAELMRRHCAEVSRRIGGKAPATPVSRKELEAPVPWWRGGKFCGRVPHEHASLAMYAAGGVERFEACSEHRAPVRLYTVLRDPVAKFLSACYFWPRQRYFRGWQVPKELTARLASPGNLTEADVDALAAHIFRFRAGRRSRQPGRAGALLQYSQVLSQLHSPDQWDAPTTADTARACSRLASDFTVGTTDQVGGFTSLALSYNEPR